MEFDITLLHPSKWRAIKAYSTYSNWMQKASGLYKIQHIISVDNNDNQASEYNRMFDKSIFVSGDNDSVVQATNRAAKYAKGSIIIYLSDDFDCPQDWDSLIMDKKLTGLKLLKVDDCLQKFHVPVLTIPIMTKELYDKLGYFWHPLYKSMFVDEDLYWTCRNNGWLVEAPELKFEHKHACVGKAENDLTYQTSAKNWEQGKGVFQRRKQINFPL